MVSFTFVHYNKGRRLQEVAGGKKEKVVKIMNLKSLVKETIKEVIERKRQTKYVLRKEHTNKSIKVVLL